MSTVQELIDRLDTDSPILENFQQSLHSCWGSATEEEKLGLSRELHSQVFPSYAVFKKQLVKEFGRDVFEQDKAMISRTLQNIVERAEFLARSVSPRASTSTSEVKHEGNDASSSFSTKTNTTTVNNRLYTWGRFLDSTEDETSYINPTLCNRWAHSPTTIVQVACSWQMSSAMYLTESGDVYRCDAMEDDLGQTSDFPMLDRSTTVGTGSPNHPQLIRTFTQQRTLRKRRVVSIASGSHHCVALCHDGCVFTWGAGSKGQLGHGDTIDQETPREIAALGEHHVISIAAGGQHTLFLCETLSSGSLFRSAEYKRKIYGCGDNRENQLGNLFKLQGILTKIKTTNQLTPCSCNKLPKGFTPISVQCGWDFSGVMGYDKRNKTNRRKSTRAHSRSQSPQNSLQLNLSTVALGNTPGEGLSAMKLRVEEELSSRSSSVSSTSEREEERQVQQQQKEQHEQNEQNEQNKANRHKPIMKILMWGRNDQGQCGTGTAEPTVKSPKYVKQPWPANVTVKDFSCGQGHSLCVAGGDVYVWGNGENGQLGTHQVLALEPEAVESVHFRDRRGVDTAVVRVCAGPFHSVAVTAGGRVFTWGMNSMGALGIGHTNNRGTPTQVTFPEMVAGGEELNSTGDHHKRRKSVSFCDRLVGQVNVWTSFHATVVLCTNTVRTDVIGSNANNNNNNINTRGNDTLHGTNTADGGRGRGGSADNANNANNRIRGDGQDALLTKQYSVDSGGSGRIKRERDNKTKWLEEVVPRWHRVCKETWVRKMMYEGVPAEIRMYVWPLCIGNGIKATPEMFYITIERARQLQSLSKAAAAAAVVAAEEENEKRKRKKQQHEQKQEQEQLFQPIPSSPTSPPEQLTPPPASPTPLTPPSTSTRSYSPQSNTPQLLPSPNKAKESMTVIDADLNRTFPQMKLFGDGGHWGDDLRCVLEAFACHRPDLGYVQGMSYIAAMLLLHIPDRYMVFQCLANLLVKGYLFPFYTISSGNENYLQYCDLFTRIISRQLPALAQHLDQLDITPIMYFYPWAQTIFLKYLPASTASRVWDNFLAGGEIGGTAFIFRTSVAILFLLAQDIIGASMETVMLLLQRRPSVLHIWEKKVYDERILFGAIEKIILSKTTRLNISQVNGDVFEYHPRYIANVRR